MDGAESWLRKFIIKSKRILAFFKEMTRLGIRKYMLFPHLSASTTELKAVLPAEEE